MIQFEHLGLQDITNDADRAIVRQKIEAYETHRIKAELVTFDTEAISALIGHQNEQAELIELAPSLSLVTHMPQSAMLSKKCIYPHDYRFSGSVYSGILCKEKKTVGHWVIHQRNQNEFQIEFVFGESTLLLLPTRVEHGERPVYLALPSKIGVCCQDHSSDDVIPKVGSDPTTIKSTTCAENDEFEFIDILVGYTSDVLSHNSITEVEIKNRLMTFQDDLKQSLINSNVNTGVSPGDQVHFKVRLDLVNTNADQIGDDGLGMLDSELADELAKPTGKYSALHTNRDGANLVFMIIEYQTHGYFKNQYAVIPFAKVDTGMFHHELGHMICYYFGGQPKSLPHAQAFESTLQGTSSCECSWGTIMTKPLQGTRLNCWSSSQLSGFSGFSSTQGKNCAALFVDAAVKILELPN